MGKVTREFSSHDSYFFDKVRKHNCIFLAYIVWYIIWIELKQNV